MDIKDLMMDIRDLMTDKSTLMPVFKRAPLRFVDGRGAWLIDDDGRHYLDFAAGIAVNAFGYRHERLVKALQARADGIWHSSNLYESPEQEKLGQLLAQHSFADVTFFCNSGAEAVEGAIKIMRKHHAAKGAQQKTDIITFAGAFHGRTLTALAAGGDQSKLDGFGPVAKGFKQVNGFDMAKIRAACNAKTAGVLLEPIQGEGGVHVAPPEFLRALRAWCDEKNLLLALDEVQCGLGRTGRLFAYEWADIEPDIMTLAKGLGGGFPVGAVLATHHAAQGMVAGSHGSTFGGNILAMALGAEVMQMLTQKGFLDEVRLQSIFLRQHLARLLQQFPDIFTELRGEGLMLGLKCQPSAIDMQADLQKSGLLTVAAGDNVLRLLPPLIITQKDISTAIRILEQIAGQYAAAA